MAGAAAAELKQGRFSECFINGIERGVERLAEALPAAADNPNELPNRLLIHHPRP